VKPPDGMAADLGSGVKAGIVINDRHDYLFIGHMTNDRTGCDWLACIYRPKATTEWLLTYRFRYDMGTDDPFDGADVKNWYSGRFPATKTDGEIVRVMDGLVSSLAAQGFGRTWRRVIKDRSFETLFDELKKAPFTHFASRDGVGAKPTTNERGQA
jgi:hypothetical protein